MPTCWFSRMRLKDHREAVPFGTIVDVDRCRDVHFMRKGNLTLLISAVVGYFFKVT